MPRDARERLHAVTSAALISVAAAALGISLVQGGAPPAPPAVDSGPFQVLSTDLLFDGGAPRSLDSGERVRVAVEIAYLGTGEIEGVFELAEPGRSPDAPVYRPLRRVRRAAGPGERLRIRGPELPSDRVGPQRVRFRLLSPPHARSVASVAYEVDAPVAFPASPAR